MIISTSMTVNYLSNSMQGYKVCSMNMLSTTWMLVILIGAISIHSQVDGKKSDQISIAMPDIRPDHAEQYLCVAHRLAADPKGQYIVGFNPRGEANRVHHMLMYGCQQPGIFQRDSPYFVWDCGEMHSTKAGEEPNTFEEGPVCRGKQHILYGWALDAPALKLPKAVGFKVGGSESDIQFLVLQVHYGHYHAFAQLPELTDNSGLVLDMKPNDVSVGINKQAGVLLLMSYGHVKTGTSRHEIWCDINEDIDIHPFRYRVHTHKLGTKVYGAKFSGKSRELGPKSKENAVIGIGDPQKPQTFYPTKDKDLVIKKGDTVYAYCEFNNNQTSSVNIGQTAKDEMCNFYLMYWTSSPKLLSKSVCWGENPKGGNLLFSSLW